MGKYIDIEIDGDKITVDVHGAEGKKCLSLTQFIEKIKGIQKLSSTSKTELRHMHIPTELKVG